MSRVSREDGTERHGRGVERRETRAPIGRESPDAAKGVTAVSASESGERRAETGRREPNKQKTERTRQHSKRPLTSARTPMIKDEVFIPIRAVSNAVTQHPPCTRTHADRVCVGHLRHGDVQTAVSCPPR
ncbi:hypothetical protein EYF80_053959 [Liparis tanakae]|uniref:Uncharacterized protein n=1 Tax=Liparis tanakae TaxID=230148 RepID=A0A4Z2F3Z6_9TELE|nr:hypothetical protein EYF80_053959 [Liparis tanakae]